MSNYHLKIENERIARITLARATVGWVHRDADGTFRAQIQQVAKVTGWHTAHLAFVAACRLHGDQLWQREDKCTFLGTSKGSGTSEDYATLDSDVAKRCDARNAVGGQYVVRYKRRRV